MSDRYPPAIREAATAIRAAPEFTNVASLAATVRRSEYSVFRALREMQADGEIEKIRLGVYEFKDGRKLHLSTAEKNWHSWENRRVTVKPVDPPNARPPAKIERSCNRCGSAYMAERDRRGRCIQFLCKPCGADDWRNIGVKL